MASSREIDLPDQPSIVALPLTTKQSSLGSRPPSALTSLTFTAAVWSRNDAPGGAAEAVRSLHFFGSLARGDAHPDSDADLLVEFSQPVGLFQFFRVQRRLEAILGCRVDLVLKDAIKPQLRTRILAEAVSAT